MADYTSGRVTVPVIPTVSGIQSTIGKEFERVKPTVTASVKVDTKGLSEVGKAKLDADDKALNAKLAAARAGLEKLQAQKASPEIDAKITAAQAKLDQLRAGLRDLEAKPSSPKVDADIAAARAKIAQVEGQIQRLNAEKASPKLDADISAGEAKVKALEAEVKSFAERRAVAEVSVQDDGQSESRIGGLFDRVKGKAATLGPAFAAAGLAAGAALVGAISMTMDISDARAKLTAQLGLTPAESERYGRLAGQVYSNAYGDSLDQVNDALASITRNIGNTAAMSDADLQGVTGTVLNLASTFGVDLNEATRAVGTMMKTGMAPDAKSALDIITVGLQGGVNVADDLFDTFSEYSTQFRKLGLDGTTATGLLSQGLKAGARDADTVADALKEFSIRAIDGSKSTAAGFTAVGLKADDMASKIAAGGPAAQEALGLTLDRLRAIEDPVARDAAAVQLFGTKAEDLGAALYALDPTTAAQGLGEVTGAGDKMNETLGDTASSRIETFKRSLQTGIVDFIGGVVLPPLMALGDIGASLFGPAWDGVRSFLGFLAGTGGVIAGVILAIAAAVKLWAFATTTLNFAFLSSPITWIVVGIVAVVGAVIYAYTHFEWFRNLVQTVWSAIQTAFSAAWSVIQSVFSGLWSALQAVGSFFVTVWGGIVTAVRWLGDAFSWLWSTILSPVFSAIGLAARVLAAIVFTVLVTPIILGVQLLAAIFTWWWQNVTWPVFQAIGAGAMWLWQNALLPAWNGIQVAITALGAFFTWLWVNAVQPALSAIGAFSMWLWTSAILPAWNLIQAGIAFLGSVFTWLYANVVQPVFSAIGAAISWWYSNIVTPVFSAVQAALGFLGSIFSWLWTNAVQPAFSGIGSVISSIWNGVIRPAFDGVMAGVRAVGDAFGWAVDKIGQVWGRIQDIVRPPVEFVVNAVYNNGIRPAWNFIAGIFDLGELPELRFATGGLVPGYAPGQDTVHALLSPGEGVLTPQAVKMIGPETVLALNAAARGSASPVRRKKEGKAGDLGYPLTAPRFAEGGIVGWLWDAVGSVGRFVGGVADFLADPVAAVRNVFADIATGGLLGVGQLSEALLRFPGKVVDSAIEFLKALIEREGAAGAEGAGRALAFAHSQVGKPYVWAAAGPGGYDCSGFMSAITNVIRGSNPFQRLGATGSMPWSGFTPGDNSVFVIGSSPNTGDGIGHMAGTLLGQNVESAGGVGVRVGGSALGAHSSLFPAQYAFRHDQGGLIEPGLSLIYNGTGKPEAVFTDSRFREALDVAGGSSGGVFEGDLYLDSGEFLGAVRGVVRSESEDLGGSLARGRRG